MTTEAKSGKLQRFPPNSKKLEAFLAAGYGMDKAKAETIIAEREANPASWPYEMYEKAQAFLAALSAKPEAVALNPGWVRDKTQ